MTQIIDNVLKVDQNHFNLIVSNMLINRDTFDKEMYKLIHDYESVGHNNKIDYVKYIEIPNISIQVRSQFHKYSRTNIEIYSLGHDDEFRNMKFSFNSRYIYSIKKKYNTITPILDINSLIKNFKQVLISDISCIIDNRLVDLIKNLSM